MLLFCRLLGVEPQSNNPIEVEPSAAELQQEVILPLPQPDNQDKPSNAQHQPINPDQLQGVQPLPGNPEQTEEVQPSPHNDNQNQDEVVQPVPDMVELPDVAQLLPNNPEQRDTPQSTAQSEVQTQSTNQKLREIAHSLPDNVDQPEVLPTSETIAVEDPTQPDIDTTLSPLLNFAMKLQLRNSVAASQNTQGEKEEVKTNTTSEAPQLSTTTSILQNFNAEPDEEGIDFDYTGLESKTTDVPNEFQMGMELLSPPEVTQAVPANEQVKPATESVPTSAVAIEQTTAAAILDPDMPPFRDTTTELSQFEAQLDLLRETNLTGQASNNQTTTSPVSKLPDPSVESVEDLKADVDGHGVVNDVDAFGEPRLVERQSRGKTFLAPNPKFQGNETNSDGEQTHLVIEKDGERILVPDQFFSKLL